MILRKLYWFILRLIVAICGREDITRIPRSRDARDNFSAVRNSSAGKTCQWLRTRSGNIKRGAIKGRNLVVVENEIIFNCNSVPTYTLEGNERRVRVPEETGPPFEANFNDAIKIWRSLGGAARFYIFSGTMTAHAIVPKLSWLIWETEETHPRGVIDHLVN